MSTLDRYIIAKEHACYLHEGQRPVLSYIVRYGQQTYDTYEEARDAYAVEQLPLGWVIMKLSQLYVS